jgi:subtilisin family serine protease
MSDQPFRRDRTGARAYRRPVARIASFTGWLAAVLGTVVVIAAPAQGAFIGAGPPPIHLPPPPPPPPPRLPITSIPRFDPTFRSNSNNLLGGTTNTSDPSSAGGTTSSRKARTQARRTNTSNNNNGVPPSGERRYIPDQVVFEVNGRLSDAQLTALLGRLRLTLINTQRIGLINTTFYVARITDGASVTTKIRALNATGRVRAAQPNYLFELVQTTAVAAPAEAPDPSQYALAKLHLDDAHNLTLGDNVLVAVIDSGIDTAHPALTGIVQKSFDALHSSEGPGNHGTAIAGIIAGHGHLSGAAPSVRILAARAFGTTQGSTTSILASLDWAVAEHARVVNMSFAGPSDPAFERALAAASQKGAVLVAATGNAGPKSPPLWPAADAHVIGVTATDFDDHLFAMANRGRQVAIAAPGVDILVARPGNSYKMETGTSFSAAFVSGVAALMIQRDPKLTPAAVQKVLLATAHDLGPKGRDEMFGAGLMDAFQAVNAVVKATDSALQLQH